ncbi:MAG: uridine kinase, partial [Marinilabiliaceae bacterium]
MLIIGVAGGSGSGKTTVVNKIVGGMDPKRVAVISQDNYYNDNRDLTLEQRRKINFDHPDAIEFPLLISHLRQLREGRPVNIPTYSFVVSTRLDETVRVEPRDVIIVEGILVLAIPELRDLMNIKVFVDADADDRLARRILRDVAERGRELTNVLHHYETTVKPMHLQF